MQGNDLKYRVVLLLVMGLCSLLLQPAVAATKNSRIVKKGSGGCIACHDDLAKALPSGHESAKGKDFRSCMECHAPEERGVVNQNSLAVRIHWKHLQPPVQAKCLDCHSWKAGKGFGLTGTKEKYGAPTKEDLTLMQEVFTRELQSSYLGAKHAAKGVGCAGCHGRDITGSSGAVDNATCLACHQPMDALVAKTAPKDFPDRNPHNSHLGEISCTVCHFAHSESKVYCLQCHPKFDMKIQ